MLLASVLLLLALLQVTANSLRVALKSLSTCTTLCAIEYLV
jgi:hypothetical protein